MLITIDWASVWEQGKPFLLWVAGMVVYAIFVFSFYEKVSRRLIFETPKPERGQKAGFRNFLQRVGYAIKYLFIAPLFLFGWFVILAGLLLLMKTSMPLNDGLLVGMSMLAAIRVCAYYNEGLAEDLGKILPLSLLAIFMINRNEMDFSAFFQKISDVPTFLGTLAIYFVFTVVLEFLLRLYDAIANRE